MQFQGRGSVFLSPRDANGNPGAYVKICTDTYLVSFQSESWTHVNKCGAVDVEDARGTKSVGATVELSFADVKDYNFAIAALGTQNNAASDSVVDEVLPQDLTAGSFYFLGGATRHRGITALTISGMVADTDYTLDAATGRLEFLTDQSGSPAPTASYTYSDPADVAMLNGPQREWFAMFEGINKMNSNDPFSYELYRVRFDPAQGIDLQSDELQILRLTGSALADPNKESTDPEGNFGRRVL